MGLDNFWRMPPLETPVIEMFNVGGVLRELTEGEVPPVQPSCPEEEEDETLVIRQNDPEFDPPLELCGGMFSGNGSGSFRGKVYNQFIEDVTGVSLYQEVIPNSVVREMSAALEKNKWLKDTKKAYDMTKKEFKDLQRMFKVYSEAGADLLGWW